MELWKQILIGLAVIVVIVLLVFAVKSTADSSGSDESGSDSGAIGEVTGNVVCDCPLSDPDCECPPK